MRKLRKILILALGFILISSLYTSRELYGGRWECVELRDCPDTGEFCSGDVMEGEFCTMWCKTGDEYTDYVICEAPEE